MEKFRPLWNFLRKNSILNIVLLYNMIQLITAIVFYYLIPILLNYPPYMPEMIKILGGIPYFWQFVIIILLVSLVGSVFLFKVLKGINEWDDLIKNYDDINSAKKIQDIRNKCLNLSYLIYIVQILFIVVPTAIFTTILPIINKTTFYYGPKIFILLFSFASLVGIISLVFSKKIFTYILLNTYKGQPLQGRRISLRNKIFLQILPMIIVAVIFTSLIGYSRLIKEKGDLLYKLYRSQIEINFCNVSNLTGIEEVWAKLNSISFENRKDCSFIITPENKVLTSDKSTLSRVFLIYVTDLSSKLNNHVYSEDGEIQGVIKKIKLTGNKEYVVGIKFEVVSFEAVMFFIFGFISLILINFIVLSYFSKSLSDDISLVAQNLNKIAQGAVVDLDRKIPVTSNDEIGDLVIAFNKIQEREKQHIYSIEEKQNLLLEKERLASLGQLIGGIAHNLRTPIMSISGSIEALRDLTKEYDESIDDPNVTKDDHHDIAREIFNWLETMQPYCSYMADLISAVREQAVQLNASMYKSFTVEELVKRIEMLMNYELKKFNCTINIDLQADLKSEIAGEMNNLVQVFNNLIVNAIQSYEGKGGKIDFKIFGGEKKICFEVHDYGKGIPKEIQNRLFKEMVTTKGKYGTGLGLYMSGVNIKGRFAGDIRFESEEGKGTTFYICIPYKNQEIAEVT